MKIKDTNIKGLYTIEPNVFKDDRGYFMESFKEKFIKENFPNIKFIQDNESKSSYGVIRGLHFQYPPFEQTKLIRVIKGEIFDIAVDLRKNSSTYGKWESFILSEKNKKQLFISKGFAHGFLVKSDEAIINYKVDNYYSSDHEGGLSFNNKDLNIEWPINQDDIIISNKDLNLPVELNI